MITYLFLGLGLISMTCFLILRNKKSSAVAVSIKTLTSIFFIITALVACIENKNINQYPKNIVAILTIIGLLFGLFGDFTLDLKIYFKSLKHEYSHAEKDSDIMTYTGMGAFGVGHVLYITALGLLFSKRLDLLGYAAITGVVIMAIVIFGGSKMFKLKFGKWIAPSIIYCFLLATFFSYSLGVLIYDPCSINVVRLIGSLLFFISDIILSLTYFSSEEKYALKGIQNPEHRLYIVLNHTTYYVAQFLIAITLLLI